MAQAMVPPAAMHPARAAAPRYFGVVVPVSVTRSGSRLVQSVPTPMKIRICPVESPLPRSLGGQDDPLQKLVASGKLRPVRVDKWQIHYPATEQINVVGSGPAKMKKKDPPPSPHIPPVPKDQKPFGRIVR